MNDYIEVHFEMSPCDETVTDVMAAMLCDIGFESFVPDGNGLTAYIRRESFNEENIKTIVAGFPLPSEINYSTLLIEGQDWNSEWEKNYFQPIVVGDKCVIHSSFHSDVPKAEYDIVIDPKMAFGTGHHATTSLVVRQLIDMPMQGRSVIDMGTGTGILAILCAKRGAEPVTAIEIDEFAYVNAVENVRLNGVPQVNLRLGDASLLDDEQPVDVFIANINRNIITADIAKYASRLDRFGEMLLSGFYEDDIPVVLDAAMGQGLEYDSHTVQDKWVCLKLKVCD